MSLTAGEKALLPQAYPTGQWIVSEDSRAIFFRPHPEYFRDLDGDIMIEMELKLDDEPRYLKDQPSCIKIADGSTVSFSAHDQLDECCVRSLKDYLIRENHLGAYHPYSITALSDFAFTLHPSNMLEQVKSLRREVVIRSEKMLGADHDDTFRAKEHLAFVLDDQPQQKFDIWSELLASRLSSKGKNYNHTYLRSRTLGVHSFLLSPG